METMENIKNAPYFKEGAFLFAVLLLLGAWKFGIEGILE